MTVIVAPEYIDGAKVIKWAGSGQNPFGYIINDVTKEREEIYGFAICKYEAEVGDSNIENIYRFSCDKNWETVQDSSYDTVENAIKYIPEQYKTVNLNWQTK